jgi:fumarate reductase flavoprotein subunit
VGIRTELNRTMESGAGICRTEASLRETCDTIRQLQRRFADVVVTDRSQTFNTELTTALELGFLLDAAEALAHSALGRKESRGAHQRTDYPRRDDQNFLKHSLAYRTEGDPRIEYRPVVITRWPPGERVYGAKH